MRMWEIRESRDYPHYRKSSMRGYRDDSEEAYDCGFEDGYKAATREAKHKYGERHESYPREYDRD